MGKDAEDRHLEYLEFQEMKVPEFDTYLSDDLAPVVNKVVDLVNNLNCDVDEVKDFAAAALGAFQVQLSADATEHDTVLATLANPSPGAAKKLAADAKVAAADAALTKALAGLASGTYVQRSVADGVLAGDDAGAAAVNKALAELRTALGPEHSVDLAVRKAGCGGARCPSATVVKTTFQEGANAKSPVGVLDVAKAKTAGAISGNQLSVAAAVAGLTKAAKAAEELGASVDLSLVKGKTLKAVVTGGEGEGLADKKAAVAKAAATLNAQVFKLSKAARNAAGPVNLTKAMVTVVTGFKANAAKLAKDAGKEVKDVLSVDPKFDINAEEGTFDLDFGVKLNLPGFEDLDALATLNKVLDPAGKELLETIMAFKDKLVDMFPKFNELKEEVEGLVQKSEEVFSDMGDKVKTALDGKTDDPFAIPKTASAAASNLKTAATEPVKIVTTFADTVKMLAEELTNAATEMKNLVAA